VFHVVLHEPEIPPNTGNLMRLCVNTGCRLHLIHPLGFSLEESRLRRAGLDYRDHAVVVEHASFDDFVATDDHRRIWAYTPHGEERYDRGAIEPGDALLFGKESVGLPEEVLQHPAVAGRLRMPIVAGGRSLNLANAAAIAVYDAWRRHGFAGATEEGRRPVV
jgi:tRNA (cytidine/uridine-2'-O-)-methyltransferase